MRHRPDLIARALNAVALVPVGTSPRWIFAYQADAALGGSVIGGVTSFAAAWITQRQQANVQLLLQEKARRQELYKQFIEASKLYIDALIHNQVAVPPLVNLYSSISKMRVVSTPGIPELADKVIRMIVDTYFSPHKTLPELRAMLHSGALDPLRCFSEACRAELNTSIPS
jgi:hypothetical protein